VRHCAARDVLLVQINPVAREEQPRAAREIHDRINEVSFNAVLLKELRMLALLSEVVRETALEGEADRWAHMRIHRIAGEALTDLGASSKLNAEWAFLTLLRDAGRAAADGFLATHGDDLGRRSSFDIASLLEGV
jgi:NTE family protein